jgi:hypothetical protein
MCAAHILLLSSPVGCVAAPRMKEFSGTFMRHWENRGRSASGAIWRIMMPWWTFVRSIVLPFEICW